MKLTRPKRSPIRFAQLQCLLTELGFRGARQPQGWRFDHPPSGCIFLYGPYRANERVYYHDLLGMLTQLDWRGLMAGEAFECRLRKDAAAHGETILPLQYPVPISPARFSQLRRMLTDLGFQATRETKGWRFEHPPSGALFLFRPYRANQQVNDSDLCEVRTQLHWRGLVEELAFDGRLKSTPV